MQAAGKPNAFLVLKRSSITCEDCTCFCGIDYVHAASVLGLSASYDGGPEGPDAHYVANRIRTERYNAAREVEERAASLAPPAQRTPLVPRDPNSPVHLATRSRTDGGKMLASPKRKRDNEDFPAVQLLFRQRPPEPMEL